jgi:DNA-binding transcriptional LysR family regulator
MDKFKDMALLTAVVEKGNFAQAAKAVGLTPAMVGRRIAAQEDELGFMLFNRSTRRMELTLGGRTYYEGCQRILNEVRELEESVTSSQQTTPKGMIRLTAPGGIGSPFLVNVIKNFRKIYPEVRFDINLTSTPLDLIKEKIDLSIRLAVKLEDSSMVATKLGETSFGLYASAEYLHERGTPVSLDDLKRHDCLHMGSSKHGDYWNVIVDGNLVNFRQPWALTVPDTECLMQSIAEGMGIAMVPEIFAKPYAEKEKIVRLDSIAEFPKLTIYAIYPTRKHLPYRVNLFLDYLKDRAPEMLST